MAGEAAWCLGPAGQEAVALDRRGGSDQRLDAAAEEIEIVAELVGCVGLDVSGVD